MTLDQLTAHCEIRQVLCLCCRGLDRRDQKLLEGVYHVDARHRHGDLWEGRGHEYAKNVAAVEQPSFGFTGQHHITNIVIQLDGAVADVESYYISMHVESGGGNDSLHFVTMGGRFVDRFEKRTNAWKIAQRHVILDWSWDTTSGQHWKLFDRFPHGAAMTHDPTFPLFEAFAVSQR